MKYTKKVEQVGDASITEHIVEGNYEEVLAIFTEMNAKDAVEYHYDLSQDIKGAVPHDSVNHKVDPNTTRVI